MINVIEDQLMQKQEYLEENPDCVATQAACEILQDTIDRLVAIELVTEEKL